MITEALLSSPHDYQWQLKYRELLPAAHLTHGRVQPLVRVRTSRLYLDFFTGGTAARFLGAGFLMTSSSSSCNRTGTISSRTCWQRRRTATRILTERYTAARVVGSVFLGDLTSLQGGHIRHVDMYQKPASLQSGAASLTSSSSSSSLSAAFRFHGCPPLPAGRPRGFLLPPSPTAARLRGVAVPLALAREGVLAGELPLSGVEIK